MKEKKDPKEVLARAGRLAAKFFLYLIPGLFAVSCIFPVIWLAYTSFKTKTEYTVDILGLPGQLYFGNWSYVISNLNLGLYLWNTARITLFIIILTLIASFINGYFISRFEFRFRKLIFGAYMSNLFVPVHAVMVPTYILFVKLGFNNHWWSTILPVVCMELTTSTFLVNAYVATVPVELEEAAAIDGSSFTRTLFTIILPIIRPILTTVGIITFFHSWNEYAYSLVMFRKEQFYTISLALQRFQGEYFTDYPRMMTTIFACILPALLLYCLFSKYIMEGMVAGAIKG